MAEIGRNLTIRKGALAIHQVAPARVAGSDLRVCGAKARHNGVPPPEARQLLSRVLQTRWRAVGSTQKIAQASHRRALRRRVPSLVGFRGFKQSDAMCVRLPRGALSVSAAGFSNRLDVSEGKCHKKTARLSRHGHCPRHLRCNIQEPVYLRLAGAQAAAQTEASGRHRESDLTLDTQPARGNLAGTRA